MERKKYHPDYWDDVPGEWQETIDRMYLKEDNSNRRETRRHFSLNTMLDLGAQFGSDVDNPLALLIKREDNAPFEKIFEAFSDEQRELLEMVYIDGKTMVEIAREQKLAHSTVKTKMSRILKRLKKLL